MLYPNGQRSERNSPNRVVFAYLRSSHQAQEFCFSLVSSFETGVLPVIGGVNLQGNNEDSFDVTFTDVCVGDVESSRGGL